MPRVTYYCVLFIRRTFFDIFQNFGADGTTLADKIRTVTDSADDIRIVTNSYGMHGSLRTGFTYHPQSP